MKFSKSDFKNSLSGLILRRPLQPSDSVLEEGIALRAVDIDVVYLNGYGFPAWRGGPMFYADTVGLDKVLARVEELAKEHGPDLWEPAPLLRRLAETGQKFNG